MTDARREFDNAYAGMQEALDKLKTAIVASKEAASRGENVNLDKAKNAVKSAGERYAKALAALGTPNRMGGRTRRRRRHRKTRRHH